MAPGRRRARARPPDPAGLVPGGGRTLLPARRDHVVLGAAGKHKDASSASCRCTSLLLGEREVGGMRRSSGAADRTFLSRPPTAASHCSTASRTGPTGRYASHPAGPRQLRNPHKFASARRSSSAPALPTGCARKSRDTTIATARTGPTAHTHYTRLRTTQAGRPPTLTART